jgi:hypothetical protein
MECVCYTLHSHTGLIYILPYVEHMHKNWNAGGVSGGRSVVQSSISL